MISLELLEELIFKSNKSMYIDKSLIGRIIIDVIEKEDTITKNNFNDISFENIDWKNVWCHHSAKSGIISIDYNKLINRSDSGNDLINNLSIVQVLLHEVQHAKEKSKLRKKSIEYYLIKLSDVKLIENITIAELKIMKKFLSSSLFLKLQDKKYKTLYIELYDLIPAERIAQIDSYKYLLESIKKYPNFEKKYKYELDSLYFDYIDQYLFGYKLNNKKLNIPILDYINRFSYVPESQRNNIYKKLVEMVNKESLSFEDRIKYGFETNHDELQKLYYKN